MYEQLAIIDIRAPFVIQLDQYVKITRRKKQEKHHEKHTHLDMCISAFQYYYLRIDIKYEICYIFYNVKDLVNIL